MFSNIYFAVWMFSTYISWCACYVGYEQFQGFGNTFETDGNGAGRPAQETSYRDHEKEDQSAYREMSSTNMLEESAKAEQRTIPLITTTATETSSPSTTPRPLVPPIVYPKFNCSEDERPFNIGTYEVPTQRDLVLQIQTTLIRMFGLYQEKALDLLQDIQQATKATSDIEKKCTISRHSHREGYKKCVKQVSKKCAYITKNLVTSLERQRADVSAFIDGSICNVTEMKADPVELIKILAMQQASLEFALPGFLRLLGSCSAYCRQTHPKIKLKKPIRHMTDQDLVIKHFLTKKSYAQLIN